MAYNPGFTDVTASISIAANATSSGACTSNGGAGTYTFQLTGTWVATIQVQITRDGTNWVNVTSGTSVVNLQTGSAVASGNITANGVYKVDATGLAGVRVITTAYTSGTIIGSAVLTQNVSVVSVSGQTQVAVPGTVTTNSVPTTPLAYSLTTAASTNAGLIKVSAGNLFVISISNPTATAAYVKLYNKNLAPTVGTDVPIATIPVIAGSYSSYEFGSLGLRTTIGIAIAVTGGSAATDTSSAVAGLQIAASYL